MLYSISFKEGQTPMLYKLSHITKVFAERTVLDISDLEITAGKICTLLGSNGAGKSTLLNILAFLDTPTAGIVNFCGTDVRNGKNSLLPYRRQVVLVDQSPILFTGTVWKNVEFGLKIRKIEKLERQKRIAKALEQVGMQDFAKADAQKLSGGETKRVALARALAVSPKVLLLDEPSANVDVENQKIILEIIKQANLEGTSVIFSTHQLSEGTQLADQTILLKNGKLIDHQDDNSFVGHVVSCDTSSALCEIEGSEIQLEIAVSGRCSSGDTMELKIDSQQISFCDPGALLPEENVFSCEVSSIIKQNEKFLHHVNMGINLSVLLSTAAYQKFPVALAQPAFIHIPKEAISVSSE